MYSGQASVGGAASIRELPTVVISKLAVGPMDNNVYLLRCATTGEQLLIDAAAEPERILNLVGGKSLTGILTTHRHHDHWGALADVTRATDAPTYAHDADADAIEVPTTHRLHDQDSLTVGDVTVGVIHLVGHTPGSLVLTFDDPHGHTHLFTGDCLFPGGIGLTVGRENFESLYRGIVEKIFDRYDDETWIYPGHGDDTILGNERPHLEEWWERKW
ncbi:MAG: MBL fold metallo-hydrolase [Actinomycetales bacterium]|nr:MBL fold metallo-hydrolase [Actinomycetales bacterium]